MNQVVREGLFKKSKEKTPKLKETLITKSENRPLAEYKETLYTGNPKLKQEVYAFSNQKIWRDIQTIEKNIDNIHITTARKPSNELDRVVDRLIEKKKK
jgi:hypothetical protein